MYRMRYISFRPGFYSRAGIRGTYLGEIRSIHGRRRPGVETVGMRPRCRRNSNCFAFFHFAGVRASRAYRAALRVVERKQRQRRQKKQKKSTPSGTRIRRICLEGRSVTLTPMASKIHRSAHACTGAARPVSGCFFCLSTSNRGNPWLPPTPNSKHFFKYIISISTGTTVSLLRIAPYAPVRAA